MPASNALEGTQRQASPNHRAMQTRVIPSNPVRSHDEPRVQRPSYGLSPNHAIYESNNSIDDLYLAPALRDQPEPSPAMSTHLTVFPPPESWPTHVPGVQQNPYPTLPPPPQVPHKVWILDCKTCHTFLTNRGMEVGDPMLLQNYKPDKPWWITRLYYC